MSTASSCVSGSVLEPVLAEVMEAMTFAGIERAEEQDFDWDHANVVWGRVKLLSPVTGELWIVASLAAAVALADVVWAGEAEACGESAKALMGEIVNAVAGQVLAALDNALPVQLGLPETGDGRVSPSEYAQTRHAFRLDDGWPIGVLVRSAG